MHTFRLAPWPWPRGSVDQQDYCIRPNSMAPRRRWGHQRHASGRHFAPAPTTTTGRLRGLQGGAICCIIAIAAPGLPITGAFHCAAGATLPTKKVTLCKATPPCIPAYRRYPDGLVCTTSILHTQTTCGCGLGRRWVAQHQPASRTAVLLNVVVGD